MCRLFAFSFHKDTSKDSKVQCINLFRSLSVTGKVLPTSTPCHGDGWGAVCYDNQRSPRQYKSVLSAHVDTDFKEHTFFGEGNEESGLIHLRKKTVGEATLDNTHPFVDGRYSFIHNGTVSKNKDLYCDLAVSCTGSTDSERLFRRFLEIKKSGSVTTEEAFITMLCETKELYKEYSALNSILHDGENIYASRIINTENLAFEEPELLSYYTLHIGKNKKGDVLVSSEEIPYEGIVYVSLPNNSISSIRLSDGSVRNFQVV